jgi:two-component system cell cycle sensor histidine kinase/response regulator CckA
LQALASLVVPRISGDRPVPQEGTTMQNVTMEEFIRLAPQMAHRIRDELSIMQTAADFLINDQSIPADAREKIALLKDHLGGIAGLARQFLIITGNETNQLSVLDVREAISQLTPLLQRVLDERNQLHVAIDPDLWPIKADLNQFVDLFCVLTANARDAMSSGGILRIRATNMTKVECETRLETREIAADYVLIEVADTGVGIRKDIIDRIFEPFFTTKGPGCGFGLAKVYGTIKKINGHIMVESELGKGTIFRIYIPRHVPIMVDQRHP